MHQKWRQAISLEERTYLSSAAPLSRLPEKQVLLEKKMLLFLSLFPDVLLTGGEGCAKAKTSENEGNENYDSPCQQPVLLLFSLSNY